MLCHDSSHDRKPSCGSPGEHEHDNSVSSISIIQPGNVDLELVQKWVGQLLQEKGAQIYRMKGVLSISNADEKFVYQANNNKRN